MGNVRYQLPSDAREELHAHLLYVSSAVYEGDWSSIRHRHHFCELFYVQSGQGNFLVEGESFPVKHDDLVIVNPNIEHTEVSAGIDPLKYVVLGVQGISFDFGENNHILDNYQNHREELLFYFTAMLQETENKGIHYELVCQDLLEVVLVRVMRNSGRAFSVVADQKSSKECERVKRYIDFNFSETITLDSLSEIAHISKYYLVHTFAKYYGMSPISYLNEIRIRASKELLESTDHSIAQVAQSTGFSSQSYFSQSFRRSCGVTPGDYRKQTKKTGS